MPLKLNVSVSRKVGQPDYGSLGASCALELELNEGLLHSDLDGFQRRVRDAYVACDQVRVVNVIDAPSIEVIDGVPSL